MNDQIDVQSNRRPTWLRDSCGMISFYPLQKSHSFFLFRTRFSRILEHLRNSVENELSSVPCYIVIIASFKVRYRKFGARKRYMPFDIVIIASFQMKYRQHFFRKRYMPFDIGVLASFQIGYRNFEARNAIRVLYIDDIFRIEKSSKNKSIPSIRYHRCQPWT